jgi:RHS repeat-associated protein
VQYLHHDQQGSTRLITGEKGEVLGSYSYTPYGAIEKHEGNATTALGYGGQFQSSETGLIYLRAREYDPSTVQFLTVDPAVEVTQHLYTYAEDDPLQYSDRTGLAAEELEVPCVFPLCAPPPAVREGLESGIHAGEHALESVWNAITGEESGGDEGEQSLKESEEAYCDPNPGNLKN